MKMLTEEQRENNFERLLELCSENYLQSNVIHMLNALRDNRTDAKSVSDASTVEYLGFLNAPAGKGNHHAYLGGLTEHLLEMWNFWVTLRDILPPMSKESSADFVNYMQLSNRSVLTAIIMHDLHKAWNTFVATSLGLEDGHSIPTVKLEYGTHASSSMFTNDQKSLFIATKYGVELDAYQVNCLFNSEGGFAKSPPKFQTVLAKMVYILDELSSNVLARCEVGNTVDIRSIGNPSSFSLDPSSHS